MSVDSAIQTLMLSPKHPVANFAVADEYFAIGQTGSAVAYYLRAAEFGYETHTDFAYCALLKLSTCLDHQRDRKATVLQSLIHAATLLPERPEAWFYLAKYYERERDWAASYMHAKTSIACTEGKDLVSLPGSTEYIAQFCAEFQMAVAGWWFGRHDESKAMFLSLRDRDLPEPYGMSVRNNLNTIFGGKMLSVHEMNERMLVIKDLLKTSRAAATYKRYGSSGDGGYVLSDEIIRSGDVLISFGVDKNVDFEVEMAEIVLRVDMYDDSVDAPPVEVRNGHFYKQRIGIGPGEVSLDDSVIGVPSDVYCILKMDIEGSEYDVLTAASEETLRKFTQITIEFHNFSALTDYDFYKKAVAALTSIRRTHTPVLVHPNNDMPMVILGNCPTPIVFEVLFLNNDHFYLEPNVDQFAGLLSRNNVDLPEMSLTFP
jgi:hypothetical protein